MRKDERMKPVFYVSIRALTLDWVTDSNKIRSTYLQKYCFRTNGGETERESADSFSPGKHDLEQKYSSSNCNCVYALPCFLFGCVAQW